MEERSRHETFHGWCYASEKDSKQYAISICSKEAKAIFCFALKESFQILLHRIPQERYIFSNHLILRNENFPNAFAKSIDFRSKNLFPSDPFRIPLDLFDLVSFKTSFQDSKIWIQLQKLENPKSADGSNRFPAVSIAPETSALRARLFFCYAP